MSSVGVVIQARMGSKRLPGKVLKKIGQHSLLEHIFFRLSRMTKLTVIVATTNNAIDLDIVKCCDNHGVQSFLGDENDVLSRYFFCSTEWGFDHIVRLTADNPFVDIEFLECLINTHIETGSDYSSNKDVLPIGVGAEIFTIGALGKSYNRASRPNHKEHVNEYILENLNEFKCCFLDVPLEVKRPEIRLTIDTFEDYKLACDLVGRCKTELPSTAELIKLYDER
jgi:spore coat polysaccharide biosynthesis protein SpsF